MVKADFSSHDEARALEGIERNGVELDSKASRVDHAIVDEVRSRSDLQAARSR